MANFKNTEFAKGFNMSFADFKERYKGIFKKHDLEQAYKTATNGNVNRTIGKAGKANKKNNRKRTI